MLKSSVLALCYCICPGFSSCAGAAGLTAQEVRWLKAAAPVLAYSQSLRLPVDITVQPQAGRGAVALAMGFAKGRCKLVLSLRGNPEAEQMFAAIPPAQQDLLIETMAAHELGHCWRYVQHAWHAAPTGFLTASTPDSATRREEAYADLAALAWVQWRHRADYLRVHRWMGKLRASVAMSGASHDTRAWLGLAADPRRFGLIAQPFADVANLWRDGAALDLL